MGWLSSFFIHGCIVVSAPLETIRHWYSSHSVHSKCHDWAHGTEDRNKVSRGLYRSCWPGVVWVAVVVGHTDVHEGGVVTQRQQPVQYTVQYKHFLVKYFKKWKETSTNNSEHLLTVLCYFCHTYHKRKLPRYLWKFVTFFKNKSNVFIKGKQVYF